MKKALLFSFLTLGFGVILIMNPVDAEGNYSEDFQNAYKFAYKNGITTTNSIDKAKMNSPLTRIAMAKMLSNYAINVLGKVPDTSKTIKFSDVTEKQNADYNNAVSLAYQLGIMGQGTNKFRPNDEVTRAQFATALSRMLYSTPDGNPYYTTHLKKLKQEGIITNDNPKIKEKRGYVMVMLMRSQNNGELSDQDNSIDNNTQSNTSNNISNNISSEDIQNLLNKKQKEGWPYIQKSECYGKNGNLDNNPTKDWNGNIFNCYDKNGLGQGYRVYNNHLSGQSEGYVINGMLIGPFTDYDKNGNKFREGTYYNGELSGHVIVYFENGKIKDDFYINNYRNYGDETEYYENGNIKNIIHYDSNGCMVGERIAYYENGNLKTKGKYKDECDIYYRSIFSHNKIGDWYYYHENKQLESIEHYENGYLTGDVIVYYDNGNIKEKSSYIYEEHGGSGISGKHGEYLEYHENGKIKTRGEYFYGNEVERFEYDENGKIIGDPMPYTKKTANYADGFLGFSRAPGFAVINRESGIFKTLSSYDLSKNFDEVIDGIKNGNNNFNFYGYASTLEETSINKLLTGAFYKNGNEKSKVIFLIYLDALDTASVEFYNSGILDSIVGSHKDVAIVIKNLPNTPRNPTSTLGAKGIDCAGKLGGSKMYYKFMDKAFKYNEFSEEIIKNITKELSLDMDKFMECYYG